MNDSVDITDNEGAVVISIETLRDLRRNGGMAVSGTCSHARIQLDRALAEVLCKDCGQKLNPVEWIARAAESWAYVQRDYKATRAENARLSLRQWAVCRCGERIHLEGRSEDEKRRAATREAVMEKALETISVLIPEAAARYAAEKARKALAVARAVAGGERT